MNLMPKPSLNDPSPLGTPAGGKAKAKRLPPGLKDEAAAGLSAPPSKSTGGRPFAQSLGDFVRQWAASFKDQDGAVSAKKHPRLSADQPQPESDKPDASALLPDAKHLEAPGAVDGLIQATWSQVNTASSAVTFHTLPAALDSTATSTSNAVEMTSLQSASPAQAPGSAALTQAQALNPKGEKVPPGHAPLLDSAHVSRTSADDPDRNTVKQSHKMLARLEHSELPSASMSKLRSDVLPVGSSASQTANHGHPPTSVALTKNLALPATVPQGQPEPIAAAKTLLAHPSVSPFNVKGDQTPPSARSVPSPASGSAHGSATALAAQSEAPVAKVRLPAQASPVAVARVGAEAGSEPTSPPRSGALAASASPPSWSKSERGLSQASEPSKLPALAAKDAKTDITPQRAAKDELASETPLKHKEAPSPSLTATMPGAGSSVPSMPVLSIAQGNPPPEIAAGLPLPIHHPRMGEILAQKFSAVPWDSVPTVDIQVNPEALGPIQMSVSLQDGQARLSMSAAHETTRQLLESQMPLLQEQLKSQGIALQDISIRAMPDKDMPTASSDREAGAFQSSGQPSSGGFEHGRGTPAQAEPGHGRGSALSPSAMTADAQGQKAQTQPILQTRTDPGRPLDMYV